MPQKYIHPFVSKEGRDYSWMYLTQLKREQEMAKANRDAKELKKINAELGKRKKDILTHNGRWPY
jgi:hypothetical protein